MANAVNHLKNHLHPLGGRLIFWNFVLLMLVKVIIPHSAFQSASLLGLMPAFDSREIIAATNEARLSNNLPALKPNPKLDLAASDKLNDMAVQEYFAHISPTGISPWYWINNSQYQYSVAGENLAIGFFSAQDTVKAWLNSSSHRANILNSQYQEIGVAVKGVEISGREGILVVQMFGSPAIALVQMGKPAKTSIPTSESSPQTTPRLALNQPQTKGESVALAQEISTNNSAEPVQEPIAVQFQDAEKIAKASRLLNKSFSVYSMLIATATVIAFFFFERNKGMAFKMGLNFTLFALTVIVPAAQISLEGLIF